MSRRGFRFTDEPGATVMVIVDGTEKTLPANRSVLAGLLAHSVKVDWFCAIGQCQRCRVRINDEIDIACLREPQTGDVIETNQHARKPCTGDVQGP